MAIRITRAGVALTVGIIVLTGLIVGGLFWVKQSGEQARRDDAVKIAEEKLEQESGDDVALNSDENGENKESEASNNETTNQDSAPAEESQNGSESTQNDEASTDNTGNQTADEMAQTGTAPEAETATELPQTGPADASAVVVLGMTAFAAVSYYRSRRTLLENL